MSLAIYFTSFSATARASAINLRNFPRATRPTILLTFCITKCSGLSNLFGCKYANDKVRGLSYNAKRSLDHVQDYWSEPNH